MSLFKKFSLAKPVLATVLALLMVLCVGCATVRKLDAASILKNTKVEFRELVLDSVEIKPNLFENAKEAIKSSLLPNPQVVSMVQNLARGIIESELGKANLSATLVATSKDEDSLWVRKFAGTLTLDSLIELPFTLKDSCILAPGETPFTLTTQFPLDKRLFELENVKKYRIKGVLEVALKADGETVPLEFDIVHDIKPEEIKALKEQARESLLNGIVSDWVDAFGL
ncbi:hypothetical protein SAMN05720471_1318 [Fibrobacter sp. UWP2]|nr:hypothetical protein SAMN05720471_1318 [Fibrobacter sp. UWP2]